MVSPWQATRFFGSIHDGSYDAVEQQEGVAAASSVLIELNDSWAAFQGKSLFK